MTLDIGPELETLSLLNRDELLCSVGSTLTILNLTLMQGLEWFDNSDNSDSKLLVSAVMFTNITYHARATNVYCTNPAGYCCLHRARETGFVSGNMHCKLWRLQAIPITVRHFPTLDLAFLDATPLSRTSPISSLPQRPYFRRVCSLRRCTFSPMVRHAQRNPSVYRLRSSVSNSNTRLVAWNDCTGGLCVAYG
ncbi:hypothetical protein BC629DRAFT_509264 [Irpex lacteus]|nr:hypothetical protein BC629DRAFT_509264 [Irpex lacteus]